MAEIEGRGHRALLVGGTGLYLQAVVDRLAVPGEWPDVRSELETEAAATGTEGLHRHLTLVDPKAAARIEPSNRRRVVRALEVTLGSGRPFAPIEPRQDIADWLQLAADHKNIGNDVQGDTERRHHQNDQPLLQVEIEPEQHQREHNGNGCRRCLDIEPDDPAQERARRLRVRHRLCRKAATACR